MERRAAAAIILWAPNIENDYRHAAIDRFVEGTRSRLARECVEAGFREPVPENLPRMRDSGSYPGESHVWTRLRNAGYAAAGIALCAERAWRNRRR